jgi:nicotinate phosphoribosyltransferase
MQTYRPTSLLTDFYQLTMLQAYFLQGMNGTAVFELFMRRLPAERNFLMAAGLEQVVNYLTELRFEQDELAWLRSSGQFDAAFIDSLHEFRFTGDVDAMPEGTVFFPDEPVIRVTAPLREAQFIESRLMNLLHFQTVIASKAARSVIAGKGRRLVDFGMRRAHGAEAAVMAARASYIAGFDATATAQAAPLFGILLAGTMAHSFIQAHASEMDAFAAFARAFPDNATLLIDTYDIEEGALKAARLSRWLIEEGKPGIKAVRIDSGDLDECARKVRKILDDEGCSGTSVFASGNLDEYAIEALLEKAAPIDGFGVGTRMDTSSDLPYLDCAYKLVEYEGVPRRKRSTNKVTWPGRKQVFRHEDNHGTMQSDTLALQHEVLPGYPLLRPTIVDGKLANPLPSLQQTRAYAKSQLDALPAALRSMSAAAPYDVAISPALHALSRQVDEQLQAWTEADRTRWGFEDE